MLKLIIGLLISGSAMAADIYSTGPKSGPTTQLAQVLGKHLGNLDVEASGDCQTDLGNYRRKTRALLVTGHAAMLRGQAQGKNCQIPWDDHMVFQANTYYLICRRPQTNVSITDDVKIAVPGVYPTRSLAIDMPRARFINVPGGGESLAAVISGDVHWAIIPSPSTVEPQARKDIVCDHDLNQNSNQYLGKTVPLKHQPFYTLTFIFARGYSPSDLQRLRTILSSSTVNDFINANHWYNIDLQASTVKYQQIVEQHMELYKVK